MPISDVTEPPARPMKSSAVTGSSSLSAQSDELSKLVICAKHVKNVVPLNCEHASDKQCA